MVSVFKILFFLYLCIFPFGQLGRIEISPHIPLHLADIVVGITATLGTIALARGVFKLPTFSPLFIAFLALVWLSLLVNMNTVWPDQFLVGSFYAARLCAYFVFYAVIWNLCKREYLQGKFPGLMQVVGGLVVLFGFVQYFFLPDLGVLAQYGWDPHVWRLAGTFLDTGFVGILIVFFLLLNFSKIWPSQDTGSGKSDWTNIALVGFGVVALALTYSRASYLAYFAGILAIYIVRRNIKWFLCAFFALLILLPLLPNSRGEGVNLSRTSTVVYRVNNYKRAVDIIKENPAFGVGYNLYRYTQEETDSHGASGVDSSLLFILATTGVAGFMIFVQLVYKIFRFSYIQRSKVLGLALFSSLIALGVHSFFDNSLFYPWVLGWILILFAGAE